MSEPVTALNGARFDDGLVDVHEIGPIGMLTVRGDLASDTLRTAAEAVTGVTFPDLRGANTRGDHGLLWMSPDEILVLVPYREAGGAADRLRAALQDAHALVVDVSDARASFQLRGAPVREVIAKLAPVDMAPDAFGVGELRRTRFAQVAAGVWLRDATTAQVFCFRSVAEYMFTLLATAADPHAAVDHFRL